MGTTNNILFIDDSEMTNFLTKSIIKVDQLPINPYFCLRVEDALTYLQQVSDSSSFPEYIFCDINLPGKSGLEFSEEFEVQYKQSHPETKVFLLSAIIGDCEKDNASHYECVKGLYEKQAVLDL